MKTQGQAVNFENEVELKLEVAGGALDAVTALPDLAGLTPRTRRQVSVYFDTPRQDLRAAGLSLRIRHADGRRRQTMKAESASTAGLFVRREWECEVAGDTPDLSASSGVPVELISGKPLAELRPTFTAEVTRTIWDVISDDAVIELVFDEGQVTLGDSTDPVAEFELELKEGSAAALFAFARKLAGATPARIGVLTKSERGSRLLDGTTDRAAKAEQLALSEDMTAAQAFQAIAQSCLRHYRLNENLLLATRGAPALHQARVALRRLRSALSLFKPMLEDEAYDGIRAGLRDLASALGDARNLDVLIARTAGTPVADLLKEARESAYDHVCQTLSVDTSRALLLAVAEWLAVGDWLSDERTAPLRERAAAGFGAKLLDRYRKRLKGAGKRLTRIDDEARHEVRILAKKLRYAAEFFAGLYPDKSQRRRRKAFLSALETLQERLGDLNDGATAIGLLRQIGLDEKAAAEIAETGIDRDVALEEAAAAYEALIDTKRFWR
jgi:inorganic triphosphatase YgiF